MASKARNIADLLNASGKVTADDLDVGQIGGRRNLIINGGFDVWQRGTSFSNAWNYGADRWVHPVAQSKGQSASEGSYSTFTCQGSSNGAYGFTSVELPVTGSNYPFIVGQAVTLSFRVNSTSRVKPYFDFRNGVVGASNGFTTDSIEYKGGSGVWETVSWTVVVTATCGGSDNCLSISFGHEDASATVAMTQVQLELGSVATPFEHRSYGEELALCQRYYCKSYEVGVPAGTGGYADGNYFRYLDAGHNWANAHFDFPVNMRARPTMRMWNPNTGEEAKVQADSASYTCAISARGTKSGLAGVSNTYIGASVSFSFHWEADAEL